MPKKVIISSGLNKENESVRALTNWACGGMAWL